MWETLFVLVVASVAAACEMPSLARRSVKETIVYGTMLAVGSALCIAALLMVTWPSPLIVLRIIFEPINHWLAQAFK